MMDVNKIFEAKVRIINLVQKNKRISVIATIALMLVTITFSLIFKRSNNDEYKKVPVVVGPIQVTVLSTGFVQPENRLEIKPQVSGRIDSILVREGQYVRKGDTIAIISSTERAALIDAARGISNDEVKKWEEYYKPIPVIAPINGTIINRSMEPGQTFTTSTAILVMSDRLSVKAQVDETDIAKVHLKQKANILLDAYPNELIPGYVDEIAYEAKTISNVTTYIVDVIPYKTPKFMLSGMTANVTFFIDNKDNALLIPSEAIKSKDNYFFVLVEDTDSSKPIETKIETGVTDGKNVEVVSGLTKDNVVLISRPKKDKAKQSSPFSPVRKKN